MFVGEQPGDAEDVAGHPFVGLALGATAAHPSSILRAPDDQSRHDEMKRFVQDLRRVAAELR